MDWTETPRTCTFCTESMTEYSTGGAPQLFYPPHQVLPSALAMRVLLALHSALALLAALPTANGFAPHGSTESLSRRGPRVHARGGARRRGRAALSERPLCGSWAPASRSPTVCAAAEDEGGIEAAVERERVEVEQLRSELEALGAAGDQGRGVTAAAAAAAVGNGKTLGEAQENGMPRPAMPALLAADVASALTSAFFLAPVVAAVDKAVVECASGRATTVGSFMSTMKQLVSDPFAFFQSPAFLMIFAVYGLTYIAANVVSTTCRRFAVDDAIPKFSVVLGVNIYASLLKDAAFAKLFSDAGASMMVIPIVTYALWFFRDMVTILVSFNVRCVLPSFMPAFSHVVRTRPARPTPTPPPSRPHTRHTRAPHGRPLQVPAKVARFLVRNRVLKPTLAASAAQVLCPVGLQLFTTPIHLLGLNFANHHGMALVDRLADVQGLFAASCAIRMVRVLPAFGFGGLGNNFIRDMAHAKIVARRVRADRTRFAFAEHMEQRKGQGPSFAEYMERRKGQGL